MDESTVMAEAAIKIPVYRGSILYGLEMNDIEPTEENIKKAAEMIKTQIEKMAWYNDDEPIFGDDAATSIIGDNNDKF